MVREATEFVDLLNFVGYSLQYSIFMETVEGVDEIKFSHDLAVRHVFDEASDGMDNCLASSFNAQPS